MVVDGTLDKETVEYKDEKKRGRIRERDNGTERKANGDERRGGEMKIAWWNGGGKLVSRLCGNPGLQKFIASEPDIFVYGEALISRKTKGIELVGYNSIVHKSKINGVRRGMVIYYKQMHAYTLSTAAVSKVFDIFWLRMKNPSEENIFCFFYAPGSHHEEKLREQFYDELRKGIDKFKGKKIYMLGDTNARLGEYSGDTDIHGNTKMNTNKPLFMGFLQYTGMIYLNRIYAHGIPTYEIWGQKRSIIDVALANNLTNVKLMEIDTEIMGANAQNCHKIIKLTIKISGRDLESPVNMKKVQKFRHCSEESLMRVRSQVARKLRILKVLRALKPPSIYQYDILRRIYLNAKVHCIGYSKRIGNRVPTPVVVKTIQAQMMQTADIINRERAEANDSEQKVMLSRQLIQKYQTLEKQLYSFYEQEKQRRWEQWVRKLNNLDHVRATRAFYAELKHNSSQEEQFGPIVNKKGVLSTSLKDCMANWKNYYAELYKGTGDQEKLIMEETSDIANKKSKLSTEQNEELDRGITITEVVEAIFTLRSNTAAGNDSILSSDMLQLLDTSIPSENWKNVEILRYLHKMIVNMWEAEKVPKHFKETVIRPFLKNTDKSPTNPSNYRPVALLNVQMKIYEQIIKARLVPMLEKNKFFSRVQAAYRKARSTNDHILVIQELFYAYRFKTNQRNSYNKRPLYLCLMDLEKAFDTVPRNRLFSKLRCKAGVQGKMFRVIKDLYTDNTAKVRVGAYESESFHIKSGVMQGSKLGPILFNIYINDLLEILDASDLGVSMGSVKVTDLGFADDLILLADEPAKLQTLIDICATWSSLNGMRFNIKKCKVLPLNVSLKGLEFKLYESTLELVTETKYLGVTLSRSRLTSLYTSHLKKVLEKAEVKANVIRHQGFHRDGLRPVTSIRMYKTIVRPTLEYAAQVLSYRHYYFTERKNVPVEVPPEMIQKLERFQNRTLKKLVSCPKNTPPAIVRLLTGTMSISARMDILKLRYHWKLQKAGEDNLTHLLYKELRKKFLDGPVGYTHEIFNICCKYDRIDLWHGTCPPKINPLARIKRIVEQHNLKKDIDIARSTDCAYSRLKIFKEERYTIEPWLKSIGRFSSATDRQVFLYALLDVSTFDRECQNCAETVKDITTHGLQNCYGVQKQRKIFINMMEFYDLPGDIDLKCKLAVFRAALLKKCWLKVWCEFLSKIWNWHRVK